jgi:hypothetical protein
LLHMPALQMGHLFIGCFLFPGSPEEAEGERKRRREGDFLQPPSLPSFPTPLSSLVAPSRFGRSPGQKAVGEGGEGLRERRTCLPLSFPFPSHNLPSRWAAKPPSPDEGEGRASPSLARSIECGIVLAPVGALYTSIPFRRGRPQEYGCEVHIIIKRR